MKLYKLLFFIGLILLGSCSESISSSDLIMVKSFNYPILKGKENNPVLRICIKDMGENAVLNEVKINLNGTNLNNIADTKVYFTGNDSLFNTQNQFGKTITNLETGIIKGSEKLKAGNNYLWISYKPTDDAVLTEKINTKLEYLSINGKPLAPIESIDNFSSRMGVAVRKHMDDNVHTYRIPGLATSNKGTLLAIYDIRRESGRDLQGHMDIGLSRSVDGGQTWEPMQIVLDMKTWGGLPEKFNGVSDANILVDKNTNDIYIAGLWMHGVINKEGQWITDLKDTDWNHQWRNKGSQPGLGPKQTSQFLITKSSDDGKTWGDPVNLTEMCKDPKWWLWAPAPGHGITLKDGTLVFPTQGRDENGLPFSNITFSKDGGKTWKTSNAAAHNTTECMVVELSNGTLMLNMRDNRNRNEKGDKNGRNIAITKDLGETWAEHPTSHSSLIEPVCMASIHRHDYKDNEGNQQSVLLFSNPNSKFQRIKQTIKVSFDEGQTWPEKYWIELDEGRGAGYSCLTSIDENHIGILYEGSQAHMTFQVISLNEILGE